MGLEWLKPNVIFGTILYALIGVIVLWLSFVAIDKLTPYKLWEEICDKKNLALAIVVSTFPAPERGVASRGSGVNSARMHPAPLA
jgi:putative membrane protein